MAPDDHHEEEPPKIVWWHNYAGRYLTLCFGARPQYAFPVLANQGPNSPATGHNDLLLADGTPMQLPENKNEQIYTASVRDTSPPLPPLLAASP